MGLTENVTLLFPDEKYNEESLLKLMEKHAILSSRISGEHLSRYPGLRRTA